MNTQVMQILILMVQYLQNVAFSLEKGSNGQNHSLSDSHHPILLVRFPPPNKKNPSIIFHLPFPLTLFGKPWDIEFSCERPISSVPDKITGCPFAKGMNDLSMFDTATHPKREKETAFTDINLQFPMNTRYSYF